MLIEEILTGNLRRDLLCVALQSYERFGRGILIIVLEEVEPLLLDYTHNEFSNKHRLSEVVAYVPFEKGTATKHNKSFQEIIKASNICKTSNIIYNILDDAYSLLLDMFSSKSNYRINIECLALFTSDNDIYATVINRFGYEFI